MVRAYFFHHRLEILRLHRVRPANAQVQLGVARFHRGDVHEHLMVAEHSLAGIENLHPRQLGYVLSQP